MQTAKPATSAIAVLLFCNATHPIQRLTRSQSVLRGRQIHLLLYIYTAAIALQTDSNKHRDRLQTLWSKGFRALILRKLYRFLIFAIRYDRTEKKDNLKG